MNTQSKTSKPKMSKLGTFSIIAITVLTFVQSAWTQSRADKIVSSYSKTEYRIKMRDGKELHTVVFAPKDQSKKYPIMMNRTPYSCRPYGKAMPSRIGPSKYLEDAGYIFVKQDVRGRWMSAGNYDNMRPHVKGDMAIDESSDTYDTIAWLLKNIKNNNGKVGI